jgi:hypothetical protein
MDPIVPISGYDFRVTIEQRAVRWPRNPFVRILSSERNILFVNDPRNQFNLNALFRQKEQGHAHELP